MFASYPQPGSPSVHSAPGRAGPCAYTQPFPFYPSRSFDAPPPSPYPRWPYGSYVPQVPTWSAPIPETADGSYPLTFVLVHGLWADSGYWDEVAAELRMMGHTVFAPEYSVRPETDRDIVHADYSHSIASFIASRRLNRIVLVGHSFGGTVVQKAAESIPERIKRLVFMNAFVLEDGQSAADELPPATRETFETLRQSSADDTIMLPFPIFRETFANLAGLELAKRLYGRIKPEPASPLFETLDLRAFYGLNVPKSYIHLTEDTVLPQSGGLYGWHPHMSERLGLFRLIRGRGDHMSTVKTDPHRIARYLYEAARD